MIDPGRFHRSRPPRRFRFGAPRSRDPLTGLPDRGALDRALAARLARLSAGGAAFAVAMIDLAGFKTVNDTYGHATGDALLVALAARFGALLGPDEFLARIGGDEFAALLPFGEPARLDGALARLRCAVDGAFHFDTFSATCGAGIGVALAPADGTDAALLLRRADLAMYRAKRAGPAATCFFSPAIDDAWRIRRDLGVQLRESIGDPSLFLEFHPLHAASSAGDAARTPIGFEAVPRWDHPALGPLPAETLAVLAEEGAAVLPLAAWTLRRACRAAASWESALPVAVDLPPPLLADPDLPELVAGALRDAGLCPSRLFLEVTEQAVLRDRDRALLRLGALRRLGTRITLDGFGPPPCSLAVLRAFPFDRLKLHPSALDPGADPGHGFGFGHADRSPPLVLLLSPMARALGIPVIAQGVDGPERLALANRAGCAAVQGLPATPFPEPASAPSPPPGAMPKVFPTRVLATGAVP